MKNEDSELRNTLEAVYDDQDTIKDSLIDLLGFVVLIVGVVGVILLQAWIISILWLWYVVPNFNLPVLDFKQITGLILLIGLLFVSTSKSNSKIVSEDGWGEAVIKPLFIYVFSSLLIWWIATIIHNL